MLQFIVQDDTIHCKKYDLCCLQGNIHRDCNCLQQDFQNKMLQTNYLLKVVTETNQTFAWFILLIMSTWLDFSSKLHLQFKKKTSIFPCSYYPTLSCYGMTCNQWWAILFPRYPWYYRSKLRYQRYSILAGFGFDTYTCKNRSGRWSLRRTIAIILYKSMNYQAESSRISTMRILSTSVNFKPYCHWCQITVNRLLSTVSKS